MIVVAGHWEIGYNTPLLEAHEWSLPLRDFKVNKWLMTPVSGIQNPESRTVPLEEFSSYDEMLNSYSELQRIFLEPRTDRFNPDTIWLHEFEHPKDCIYVFGSAHYNPTLKHKREQDVVISIKTLEDKGVLWSNQCAAIVLYERNRPQWQ